MASCLSAAAISLALLGQSGGPAAPAPPPVDPLRLAGLVSRDAETLVWIADRATFLRRLRTTPFLDAITELEDDEAMDALAAVGAELSLVFSPELLEAWAEVLERGEGDIALAVDGFTVEGGPATPDTLLLADARGLEKLVPALVRCASDRDEGEELLDQLDAPFELEDAPAVVRQFRDATIVEVRLEDVGSVAFAEVSGILFASKNPKLVERAIDRARDASVGSLRDSSRFRAVWDRLAPNPGSMVWYTNLRKLRQSDFARATRPGSLRAEFADSLRSFDGAGIALRGRGESLELRGFLERGAGRMQDPNPLFRSNERFRSIAAFPADSTCMLATRVSGEQAAEVLGALGAFVGGPGLEIQIRMIDELMRARGAMPSLLEHLDGELVVCQTKPALAGEGVPRAAFALECLDEAAVRAWFAEAARRAGPLPIQPVRIGGLDGYAVLFASPQILLRPVFVVKDGFLFGATQGFVLRDLLRADGKPTESLIDRRDFLRSFDQVDHDPRQPANALVWLDGARFTSSALTWTSCAGRALTRRPDRTRIEGIQRILEMLSDPDIEEVLKGTAVRAELREDGVLIEAAGP